MKTKEILDTVINADSIKTMNQMEENSVDVIFADPPYFLSNDGITCSSGKAVSVNKGDWDKIENLEEKLADLIYLYGEEKLSRRIARAIVEARNGGRIESSKALAEIIWNAVPGNYRYGQIHPATRTFQALRIAVNSELKRLPSALHAAFCDLKTGGKMGVITFHSLEDRIVKNYFRNLGRQCVCPPEVAVCRCGGKQCAEILTRKPVIPTDEEIKENSPSRSAKLRVVRKLNEPTQYHLEGVIGY